MTDITTNLPEKVATAIKRAYALGQLYWQQADSDSYKQNAKSDETRAKFDELLFQASANVQEAADEIDRLRAEVAGLRAFARSVMAAWPYGDVDGGFLQELAIKHGLIELKDPMPTEPCCDDCECAGMVTQEEFADGIECYRKTALLLGSK